MQDVARFRNSTKFSAMNIKIAIVFLQLLIASNGDIELTCGTARPSAQTDVTCVCRRTIGSDIQWFFNGTLISDCVLNFDCLPQPPGYTFSINVTEIAYEMTISAYEYNDCTQINCTDASNTNVQRMVVPSAINFDSSNPTPIAEPAFSHNNGMFSITTGCISGYMHVTCEWYTFNNGAQEEYTQGQSAFVMFNKSSCSNCNDDDNAKMTCGFYHIEASGNETKNVYFRVVVTHIPTNLKWEVNSTNVYTIKGNVDPYASRKKGGWEKLETWIKIVIYIVASIISIHLLIVIVFAICLCLKKPGEVTINFTSSKDSNPTRSITVVWTSSSFDFRKLVYDLTYYKVVVTDANIPNQKELLYKKYDFKNFEKTGDATDKFNLEETTFEITDLSTGTYYKVELVARNSRGNGVICKKIFQTKLAAPKIISQSQAISFDKIRVKWTHDGGNKNPNDILYSITYKEEGSEVEEKMRHELNVNECFLENLSERTKYIIKVYAYRNFTFSDPGETKIKTLIKDIKKPTVNPIEGYRTEDETGTTAGKLVKKKKGSKKNGQRTPKSSVKKQRPQGTKQTSGNPDKMFSTGQTSGNVNGNTVDQDQNVKCDKGQQENEKGTSQDNLIKDDKSKFKETDARQNGIQKVEDNEESGQQENERGTSQDNLIQDDKSKIKETDARQNGIQKVEDNKESGQQENERGTSQDNLIQDDKRRKDR